MCQSHTHSHECNHGQPHTSLNLALWAGWNGTIEVQECWENAEGDVSAVQTCPAPEGSATFFGVYGRLKAGTAFWIADFDDRSGADNLAESLRKLHATIAEQFKEIQRMTECLENPVGYVNQGVLVDLREKGKEVVLGSSISRTPNSHNNCAIYAQD